MFRESGEFLEYLREQLRVRSANLDERRFALASLVKLQAAFRPHQSDLPYADTVVLAQAFGVGSCYCYNEDPALPLDILGMDARYVQTGSLCFDIAVLDSAYGSILPEPAVYCRLEGDSSQKAETRSILVVSEIRRVALESGIANPTVTMVGAVGNILSNFTLAGWQTFATDFDPTLVGKELGGVLVEHGNYTLERVSQSHIALVTGMTLATNTLGDILTTARLNKVKVVMFVETGGNFAYEFLKLGVASVVSEEFPFYMFPGVTKLRVFRASCLEVIS